jgi:hypothetical protein
MVTQVDGTCSDGCTCIRSTAASGGCRCACGCTGGDAGVGVGVMAATDVRDHYTEDEQRGASREKFP